MAKARKTFPAKAKPARKRAGARRSPEQMLADLKARLREVSDLRGAGAVLNWDQATYMPEGGAQARGRQAALLSRLAHERWIAPEIGRLLDALAPYGESLPHEHDDDAERYGDDHGDDGEHDGEPDAAEQVPSILPDGAPIESHDRPRCATRR